MKKERTNKNVSVSNKVSECTFEAITTGTAIAAGSSENMEIGIVNCVFDKKNAIKEKNKESVVKDESRDKVEDQQVPEPHGIPGRPYIPQFKQGAPGVGSSVNVTHADVPSANSEPAQSAMPIAAVASAVPLPLPWSDLADSWMSDP